MTSCGSTLFRIVAGLAFAAIVRCPRPHPNNKITDSKSINGSNLPIEIFQFSECSSNDWRADRLGATEVIRPGQSRVFDMFDGIRSCCRDMRAKFANGVTREQMNIDVCRAAEWVLR